MEHVPEPVRGSPKEISHTQQPKHDPLLIVEEEFLSNLPPFLDSSRCPGNPDQPSISSAAIQDHTNAGSSKLLVKLLDPAGRIPTHGPESAISYDLYSSWRHLSSCPLLATHGTGTYARIAPRFGLSVKAVLILGLVLLIQITGAQLKLCSSITQMVLLKRSFRPLLTAPLNCISR